MPFYDVVSPDPSIEEMKEVILYINWMSVCLYANIS